MKKGVLISGVITIVIYSIIALVFGIVGGINIATKGMADADPGAIPAPELLIVAIVFLSIAGHFILGIIMSGILIGTRNSNISKAGGIVLGILGILFSAILPGIFYLCDSIETRN